MLADAFEMRRGLVSMLSCEGVFIMRCKYDYENPALQNISLMIVFGDMKCLLQYFAFTNQDFLASAAFAVD
jgi:hypothetical protein